MPKLIILFLFVIQLNIDTAHGQNSTSLKFQPALPGYSYQFPRDNFSHDEFRFEWWYYTGNLENESGRQFGY